MSTAQHDTPATASGLTPAAAPGGRKGRPRAFDRDEALARALGVFWRRGYEPASMTELCQAMGINAPSLYAAFGNKASLFLEAVRFYEATYWEAPARRFLAENDITRAVENFFQEAADILLSPHTPYGCMVVLAAVNVSENATEITTVIHALRDATCQMFAQGLQRAVQQGQLPSSTNVATLAHALNTLLEGLSLQIRDGLSQDQLRGVAALAVRLLP